jgi:hypothetical protein
MFVGLTACACVRVCVRACVRVSVCAWLSLSLSRPSARLFVRLSVCACSGPLLLLHRTRALASRGVPRAARISCLVLCAAALWVVVRCGAGSCVLCARVGSVWSGGGSRRWRDAVREVCELFAQHQHLRSRISSPLLSTFLASRSQPPTAIPGRMQHATTLRCAAPRPAERRMSWIWAPPQDVACLCLCLLGAVASRTGGPGCKITNNIRTPRAHTHPAPAPAIQPN